MTSILFQAPAWIKIDEARRPGDAGAFAAAQELKCHETPDLGAAERKLIHASHHLELLDAEVARLIEIRNPPLYALRWELNNESGWVSILARVREFPENDLSVIFGDVIHNMRAALDYIVAALVDFSGVKITWRHDFPIYTDRAEYIARNGRGDAHVGTGRIHGITFGLDLIESAQPYNKDPHHKHPLWVLQRFSNADKHRELMIGLALASERDVGLEGSPFDPIIDAQRIGDWGDITPGREFEVCAMRLAKPYPNMLKTTPSTMRFDVAYMSEPFLNDEAVPVGCPHQNLAAIRDYIANLIESFDRRATERSRRRSTGLKKHRRRR